MDKVNGFAYNLAQCFGIGAIVPVFGSLIGRSK